MTTIDESTIVTRPTREPPEDDTMRPEAQAWQLGVLTDWAGHVHLGAVVAGTDGEPSSYIDLLAPVGTENADELDVNQQRYRFARGARCSARPRSRSSQRLNHHKTVAETVWRPRYWSPIAQHS